MYVYDAFDKAIVRERAAQFRDQVVRRLSGEIAESEFKPLRLQNGLYMQLHAYMLRIAVPYGLLTSERFRKLAHITRKYDRGYCHLTTRQNVQLNWPELEDVPTILDELAEVDMHAIQTSGNCIRNVTSDAFAGVCTDEIEDPRPYCEILRQWSTFHPEFAFLPRKFKFAVTGARDDRAAVALHDVGIRIVESEDGEVGFEFQVGGGMGRTPMIAKVIGGFVPKRHLLSYSEAILRVYNRFGRRDNKYKARIKILVDALGADEFGRLVEAEFEQIKGGDLLLDEAELERMRAFFAPPAYETLKNGDLGLDAGLLVNPTFAHWTKSNVVDHRAPGYRSVVISLKDHGLPPGDIGADAMDAVAGLAERFSFGRLVVTHRQNLVLPDVKVADLFELWTALDALGFGRGNFNQAQDVIACPGLDYCALASARTLNVAEDIQVRFRDLDQLLDLGHVEINVSGCVNACGHHHVGHIGVLGIDKRGEEYYQLMLGGYRGNDASLGVIVGRAFDREHIAEAVETVLRAYGEVRSSADERFVDTVRRVGLGPFQRALYGDDVRTASTRAA